MSDSRKKFNELMEEQLPLYLELRKEEKMNDREMYFTIDEEVENNMVEHPKHYGGKDNPYEAIKVIEAWDLGFNLGNTLKYISRAGKKDTLIQELEKASWYLNREIDNLKNK
jgi:hypothetical protein